MHKNTKKYNETLSKWCKNKHGASKIMDTLETYHGSTRLLLLSVGLMLTGEIASLEEPTKDFEVAAATVLLANRPRIDQI
jgi:hypothetical protein